MVAGGVEKLLGNLSMSSHPPVIPVQFGTVVYFEPGEALSERQLEAWCVSANVT